jgi:hypothetical protein
MKRAFIETSSINKSFEIFKESAAFRSALLKRGFEPAVGHHVFYELQRGMLFDKHIDRMKSVLRFVIDLNPMLTAMTNELLAQEVIRVSTGAAVIPFLFGDEYKITMEGNRQVSEGGGQQAIDFVRDREAQIAVGQQRIADQYIPHVKKVKAEYPSEQIPTFEHALAYFRPRIPEIIIQLMRKDVQLNLGEAKRITERLDELPALRSTVRANIYWNWIHIIAEKKPAADKTDDPRHIIDASYCDAFMTSDEGLRKRLPLINPSLPLVGLPL